MGGHFDDIVSSYAHSMKGLETIYEQAAEVLSPLVRDRVVLDVGAGGNFAYDNSLPAKVIALDLSAKMLEQIDDPRIVVVVDDATTMHSIEDASVDVVMFCLVLHHLAGETRRETIERVSRTLDQAAKKLRPGGSIAVLEVLLPRALYIVESALFGAIRAFLRWRSRDMIHLFESSQIVTWLERSLRAPVRSHRLQLPDYYDPLAGSFPGKIRLPRSLSPTPIVLFVAQKAGT